ncbi:hypothetical protein GPEL0_01f0293 [Geoanaerobacter pelophilus]|uniref:Uncharacterized protein n=1 Tax=Geoanaerobacter pelophilus TaxID=60036 RepID=A0ABQ0MGY7_9BACT|nr:hypothetical protein GPEL0_01f0293 [Geoanaerobacter pelophilus]
MLQQLRELKMAVGLIGGGPRAFQKYEKGDLLPSRAICNALILLDRDPGRYQYLNRPERLPE